MKDIREFIKNTNVPNVQKPYLWFGYDLLKEYARKNILYFYPSQAKKDMETSLNGNIDLCDVTDIFVYYQNVYGIVELRLYAEFDDDVKVFTPDEYYEFCNTAGFDLDSVSDKTYISFYLNEEFVKDEQKSYAKEMEKEKNKRKNKPKIITLCGSTRFKEEFEKVQRELTLQGIIVLSVGLFSHAEENGEEWATDGTKQMLDDLHKRKIDMSDEIYVINKNGYIGSSTKSEIEYAKAKNMPINYLEIPKKTL